MPDQLKKNKIEVNFSYPRLDMFGKAGDDSVLIAQLRQRGIPIKLDLVRLEGNNSDVEEGTFRWTDFSGTRSFIWEEQVIQPVPVNLHILHNVMKPKPKPIVKKKQEVKQHRIDYKRSIELEQE